MGGEGVEATAIRVAYGPYYQDNQITWTLAAPLCPLTGNKKGGWPPSILSAACTPVDSSVCFLLSRRPPENATSYPEARVALINWWDQPRWWRMPVHKCPWSRNETIFRSIRKRLSLRKKEKFLFFRGENNIEDERNFSSQSAFRSLRFALWLLFCHSIFERINFSRRILFPIYNSYLKNLKSSFFFVVKVNDNFNCTQGTTTRPVTFQKCNNNNIAPNKKKKKKETVLNLLSRRRGKEFLVPFLVRVVETWGSAAHRTTFDVACPASTVFQGGSTGRGLRGFHPHARPVTSQPNEWCPCGVLGNRAFVHIHTPPSLLLPPFLRQFDVDVSISSPLILSFAYFLNLSLISNSFLFFFFVSRILFPKCFECRLSFFILPILFREFPRFFTLFTLRFVIL